MSWLDRFEAWANRRHLRRAPTEELLGELTLRGYSCVAVDDRRLAVLVACQSVVATSDEDTHHMMAGDWLILGDSRMILIEPWEN